MWIASASGRVERSPWIFNLLLKLLRQEKDVIGLLESDPWGSSGKEKPAASNEANGSTNGDNSNNNSSSPKYIRIEKYRYKFYNHKSNSRGSANDSSIDDHNEEKPYWVRERIGRYFPLEGVMTTDMLEEIVNGR